MVTWTFFGCVSTLLLKYYLIINELQNAPWPRPDVGLRLARFGSGLDAPRRGWDLWRFASLIPSGCRLTPIHKVMGDHASRGPTLAGAFLPHGLY